MKKVLLYSLFCILPLSDVMAQDTKSMYEEYKQKNLQANEDKKKLEARKKILYRESQQLKNDLEKKIASFNQKKEDLKKSKLEEREEELRSLLEQKSAMEREIQRLEAEVQNLEKSQIVADKTLMSDNDKLKKAEELKSNDKASLSKSVADYLKRSFGQMKSEQLNKLKSNCQAFRDDSDIRSFISEIDKTLQNLTVYNKAVGASNGKYVAENVNNARQNLLALKAKGLNDAQMKEVNSALQNLTKFEENYKKGIDTFRMFIELVKSKPFPPGVDNRRTVLEGRLGKNPTLQKEIAAHINTNAYLKQLYETYKTAVCQGSSQQAAIEQEIQNIKL